MKVRTEGKFKDETKVRALLRLIIVGNGRDVLELLDTSDRRMLLLNPTNERARDTEYWKWMRAFRDNGGKEAFIHYLTFEHDMSGYEPVNIPVSELEYRQELKEAGLSSIEQWWISVLRNGYIEYTPPGGYMTNAEKATERMLGEDTSGRSLNHLTADEWVRASTIRPARIYSHVLKDSYMAFCKANRLHAEETKLYHHLTKVCMGKARKESHNEQKQAFHSSRKKIYVFDNIKVHQQIVTDESRGEIVFDDDSEEATGERNGFNFQ